MDTHRPLNPILVRGVVNSALFLNVHIALELDQTQNVIILILTYPLTTNHATFLHIPQGNTKVTCRRRQILHRNLIISW